MKRKILYFSPILFSDLKQRPQHIAEELSRYFKVIYIEPSVSLIRCLKNKNDLYKFREFSVNGNLKVVRPSGKYRFPKSFEALDFLGLNSVLERRELKDYIEHADMIWIGNPIYYSLVNKEKEKTIIYDKMDDYVNLTEGKWLKKVVEKNENKLINEADYIFTTSSLFNEDLRKHNKKVYMIKNGIDVNLVQNDKNVNSDEIVQCIQRLKHDGKNVFGYIGTIGSWFDYKAIEMILDHDDNNVVCIIGYNKIERLKHKNIYYFKPVEKSRLSSIIGRFDYCLYTFKKDKFLDTIDPVKIYEYLALNKVVIGVKSIETDRFRDYIALYDDYTELKEILNNLENIKVPFSNSELNKFVKDNSWESRVKKIIEIILR